MTDTCTELGPVALFELFSIGKAYLSPTIHVGLGIILNVSMAHSVPPHRWRYRQLVLEAVSDFPWFLRIRANIC